MTGGVDQVENVLLTIGCAVIHARGLELDRDPPLPLEIHVVQELILHVTVGHRVGVLQQTIRQGRLAVVDVGDDAEIADA